MESTPVTPNSRKVKSARVGLSVRSLVVLMVIVSISAGLEEVQASWDPPNAPATSTHDEVVRNMSLLPDFIEAGRILFRVQFNVADGAGRPQSTGDSKPTVRLENSAPLFTRIAGPDANSCAGCHNLPLQGGAGDFAANVFVGAHFTNPPTNSTDPRITNERNTIGMFGAGAIELLAREMSEDLLALRDQGLLQAKKEDKDVLVPLSSKEVSFGYITARPDGTYDLRGLQGVDHDLVVKPFGSKGVAVSLREFTIFALNQHHGIQPQERFGWERTGVRDFDGDGIEEEFTVGQVSALTLYQATLPPPRRVPYAEKKRNIEAQLGEKRFYEIGCSSCHIPALPLRSRVFSEPNPFNRPGSLVPSDVEGSITLSLEVKDGTGIFTGADGRVYVAAFSDLKRHQICDAEDMYFCNEQLSQDFVPTDTFLTSKLWDVGTSGPYGHRGDLTTISEAIVHHSGEAKAVRNTFLKLTNQDKTAIITFLLSLRVDED